MGKPSVNLNEAATHILSAQYAIALVGAGLSVESGVPTFRGTDGLWSKVGEPKMNGFEDFLRSPAKWWMEQQSGQSNPEREHFRQALENAKPNQGHYALTNLEQMGLLKTTITQNIDDLHVQAGQKKLVEIHGNRTKMRCISCEARWHRGHFNDYTHLPACPECKGIIKNDTVMFGEPIPPSVLETCFRHVELSDCIIVVGTSGTVYPAAGFPSSIQQNDGIFIEANSNPTNLSDSADVVLRSPTSESLPNLVTQIRKISNRHAE